MTDDQHETGPAVARRPVVAQGTRQIVHAPVPRRVVRMFATTYDGWDITARYEPSDSRILIHIRTGRWLMSP